VVGIFCYCVSHVCLRGSVFTDDLDLVSLFSHYIPFSSFLALPFAECLCCSCFLSFFLHYLMSRSQTARSQDVSTYLPSNPNALSLFTIVLFIHSLPDSIEDSGTNMKKVYYWKDQTPTFHRTCQVRFRAAHDHVSEVNARQHVTGCMSTIRAVHNAAAYVIGRLGRRLEKKLGCRRILEACSIGLFKSCEAQGHRLILAGWRQ
jgi:hypothetical protein